MFGEIDRKYQTPTGEPYARVSGKVYDLEDEAGFNEFALGAVRSLVIPGSGRTVQYDELQRNGVGLSKLSASAAIAIGANAFAVQRLEQARG
jgi:glucokinase